MKPKHILITLLVFTAAFSKAQIITTVAGGDTSFLGNGGLATNAQIAPGGMVRTDGIGNIYISDGRVIRKITASGIITTIAGGGSIAAPSNGQNAHDLLLNIWSMALDSIGNIFIISGAINKVIKINTAGIINIVAGNGSSNYNGDGSVATSTGIGTPTALAVDRSGNFYIADASRCVVYKVNASGIITTVAGSVMCGYTGDGGPATAARLQSPYRVATDKLGNLFIEHGWSTPTDYINVVRKVNSNGIISTFTTTASFAGYLYDIAPDNLGNLYISSSTLNKILRAESGGNISTVAGTGSQGFSGDGGPATSAQFFGVNSVAVDDASNIYVTELGNNRLRKINSSNIINTIAGTGLYSLSGDGSPATAAAFGSSNNLVSDKFGNLYMADQVNNVVRKINLSGIISTIAGNKTRGFSGDDGLAVNAQLNAPNSVSADSVGNIYIADAGNYRIRKVNQNGIITTIAGNGTSGNSGDSGLATAAQIVPQNIAVSKGGTVYFIQEVMVRKVTTNGMIYRVAGRRGSFTQGYSGDGGPAINATLKWPSTIYVDDADNVFINDNNNNRIRKINTKDTITTFAGGTYGYSGDGGAAISAALRLSYLSTITSDRFGNIFISDGGNSIDDRNSIIRKVNRLGVITTVAGNGTPGYSGDGGPATTAQLLNPAGLATDPSGNLYITQSATLQNAVIRFVNFGNPLPVIITGFNVQLNNQSVLLKWQTANEVNTKSYIVQRSATGSDFSDLGAVKSINTIGSHSYTFTDDHPHNATNYYRLKIEDNDGRFTYSNILPVKFTTLNNAITVYPNPAKNKTSILFNSATVDKYRIDVVDITGRLIKHLEGVSAIGTNSITVDVTSFSPGSYFISFTSKQARQSINFYKK